MRLPIALLLAALGLDWGGGLAAAAPIPLPPARPALAGDAQTPATAIAAPAGDRVILEIPRPSPCDRRLQAEAEIELLLPMIGPGACGANDMVEVDAVLLPDASRVAVEPAAVLTCAMAESLAGWLREEAAPRVAKLGSALTAIENYDSYECRPRNRVPGAKMSEHALGEAIDLRAFHLADGRRLELTDPHVDKTLREGLRDTACRRFTTVLGPGADVFHSGHVHLDIEQRHNGYRICEWDVREPLPLGLVEGPVPLPPPRPAIADASKL